MGTWEVIPMFFAGLVFCNIYSATFYEDTFKTKQQKHYLVKMLIFILCSLLLSAVLSIWNSLHLSLVLYVFWQAQKHSCNLLIKVF